MGDGGKAAGETPRPALLKIPGLCWAICAAAVPLHVLLARWTELSPDEAYYLVAARAPGILPHIADHPPLLIWMLRATDVAGPVELRVRVWAIVLSFATSVAAVALARARGATAKEAEITAWLTSWALLPTAGGFVTTPDSPFLFLFVVGLLLVARGGSSRAGGAVLGLAAIAKVAAFPLAAIVAVVERRTRWVIVVAGALAVPLALPSLRFQLAHAFAERPSAWTVGGAASALLAAAAAQAALWTPHAITRGASVLRAGPRLDRLLVLILTLLLVVSAVVRGVPPEPNWWAPAGLLLAVAAARSDWSRGRRSILLAVLAPTALAAVHTIHPFLPIEPTADPTARLHGWRSAASEPLEAPGVGTYGPAAERCVYRGDCKEINNIIK